MVRFEKYGIEIEKQLISQRPLELFNRLVWNCRDLGMDTIHFVKEGEKYISVNSSAAATKDEVKLGDNRTHETYLCWTGKYADVKGVAREELLKSEIPQSKEQFANIMVNNAFHAYPYQTATLFGNMLNKKFEKLELHDVTITNNPRAKVGDPDILLIDDKNKTVILLELKIANSSHKYNYDQHLKYLSLKEVLAKSDEFEGYEVLNLLIGGWDQWDKNFKKFKSVGLSEEAGRVSFEYSEKELVIANLMKRYKDVTGVEVELGFDSLELCLHCFSWNQLPEFIEEGELKENLVYFSSLMGQKNS